MGRPLRIALLSYRSKPHSGGQGVYVRALSRELTALGHAVTVVSGSSTPISEMVTGSPGLKPVARTVTTPPGETAADEGLPAGPPRSEPSTLTTGEVLSVGSPSGGGAGLPTAVQSSALGRV